VLGHGGLSQVRIYVFIFICIYIYIFICIRIYMYTSYTSISYIYIIYAYTNLLTFIYPHFAPIGTRLLVGTQCVLSVGGPQLHPRSAHLRHAQGAAGLVLRRARSAVSLRGRGGGADYSRGVRGGRF
jgi:hypothetical protein